VYRVAFGIVLIFMAVFMAGACFSYLTHYGSDQSEIDRGLGELLSNPRYQVRNVFGKVGAALGHQLVYSWFGLAALVLCWSILAGGLRLALQVRLRHWPRRVLTQLFLLIWLPVALAYFITAYPVWAGANGFFAVQWLRQVAGPVGTGVLIVFSLLLLLALRFGWTPEKIKQFSSKLGQIAQKWWPRAEKKSDDQGPTDAPSMADGEHTEKPEGGHQAAAETEEDREASEQLAEEPSEYESPTLIVEQAQDADLPPEPHLPKGADHQSKGDSEGDSASEGPVTELKIEETAQEESLSEKEVQRKIKEFGEYDPKLDLSRFRLPTPDLLKDYGSSNFTINQQELDANKNRIIETLNNYKIDIASIKATIGPTVTLYEIVPAAGVRISKIKNLEDDIALSLSALGIRIIAPIPGRGTIGIEVPNTNPQMVPMRNLIMGEKFQNTDMELPIAFGKTISNETLLADLAKMPHLLMAGATGQGKSVGLNVILTSLLYKKHPSQVKFILVDPKKVELTLFNKIERHYLAKLPDTDEAIITDNQKVINTLNSLCIEMDNRYSLLKDAFCRNIKEYNHKFVQRRLNPEEGHRYLPYIVLVIDEFADLIMTAGKEVETPIARLAQLARAIGIHLIVATQRPSVNVITGVIKANFPARAAFRVSSKIDSRTILDAGGADQLIGKGDMLFHMGQDIVRLQCAFVDTPEVERITDYIGSQQGYPDAYLLPEYVGEEGGEGLDTMDPSERDSLFEDAARVLVIHQQGSTSLLQRKLKLGYNRAGRIIDQLEAAGVIGPFEGSKARQVLIPDEQALEQLLEQQRTK